jgi:hypothetical protein
MKTEDQYLKFVRWNEEDNLYVGYCPDLFPWGVFAMARMKKPPITNCVCSFAKKWGN